MRCYAALGILGAFALVVGCSGGDDNRAAVDGKVTLDGKPVVEGQLSLEALPGTTGPSVGAAIKEGVYHIAREQGPVAGEYRVKILAFRKTGRQIRDEMRAPPDNLVDEIEPMIPRKYNSVSELTVKLAPGENPDQDFALTTP